jgi:hypothetical protein
MGTPRFRIVLLPRRQVIVDHCSLAEAVAFLRGYHEVVNSQQQEAVIASEHESELAEPRAACPRKNSTYERCQSRSNMGRRKQLAPSRMA